MTLWLAKNDVRATSPPALFILVVPIVVIAIVNVFLAANPYCLSLGLSVPLLWILQRRRTLRRTLRLRRLAADTYIQDSA